VARPSPSSDGVVEGEQQRLIAWNRELLAAHERLREALESARDSLADAGPASNRADLLLYCKGFCTSLGGHHVSEDVRLFPELSARYPELHRTIAALEEDHDRIAALLVQFEEALDSDASPAQLALQLDGLAAIMESHFRYEERRLLDTLAALDLDADPRALLGPL
jgi:hemerythrin-like domain-containing protein